MAAFHLIIYGRFWVITEAVGEGVMPVREIFEALIAIKYKGFVDLEYEIHSDDPMPGVQASIAHLRGVLVGMGYSTTHGG